MSFSLFSYFALEYPNTIGLLCSHEVFDSRC